MSDRRGRRGNTVNAADLTFLPCYAATMDGQPPDPDLLAARARAAEEALLIQRAAWHAWREHPCVETQAAYDAAAAQARAACDALAASKVRHYTAEDQSADI